MNLYEMNLDEAIKHCEEVAKDINETANNTPTEYGNYINSCRECAAEHEQLALWLKELKELRERPQSEWGKWIPTSEMLPEEYDCYIVMWRHLTEGYPDRLFYEICEYEPEVDEWERIEQAGEAGAEIVAWMPMPEPYKKEGAEE